MIRLVPVSVKQLFSVVFYDGSVRGRGTTGALADDAVNCGVS